MKMKLVCLITAFILLFSVVPASAARLFYDVPEGDSLYYAVNELSALGIISGDAQSELKPNEPITKGQIAQLLESYLGLAQSESLVTGFEDVPSSHAAYHAIGALAGAGFISADKDGKMNPDSNLTLEQTLEIFLGVMGYLPIAQQKKSNVVVASDIGLMKNVKMASGMVLKRDVLAMLYNSLDINVLVQSSISSTGQFTLKEDKPILEKYRDIYSETGIVEANSVTNLYTAIGCADGYVEIGSVLYNVAESKADRFIGQKVKLYYKESIKDNEKVAVAAVVREDKNKTLRIEQDDIADINFTTNKAEYNDYNAKAQTVSISQSKYILYNGVAYQDWTFDADTFKGYVEFIDNNRDDVYDIISVWEYFNVKVASMDLEDKSIYGRYYKNNNGVYVYTSDKFTLEAGIGSKQTIMNNGTQVDFSAIKPGMMVSIFASREAVQGEGSKNSVIYLSTTVVKGEIEEHGDEEIVVEGETLQLDDAFVAQGTNFNTLTLGSIRTLYLDAFGYVTDVELENTTSPTGINYGLITDYGIGTGMDAKLALKIFGQDGKMLIADVADKVELNGEMTKLETPTSKMDASNPIISIIIAAGNNQLVVRYRVNADGEINFIDTPSSATLALDEKDPDALVENAAWRGNAYVRNGMLVIGNAIAGTLFIDDKQSVVFMKAGFTDLEDYDYAVVKSSKFIQYSTYNVTAYNMNEFGVPKVVFATDSQMNQISTTTFGSFSYNTAQGGYTGFRLESVLTGQITAKSQGINNEGDAVIKLTIGGKAYSCTTTLQYQLQRDTIVQATTPATPLPAAADTLSVGDHVRFKLNNRGEIYALYPDVKMITSNSGIENAILTSVNATTNTYYMYNNLGDTNWYSGNYADFCYGFVYSKDPVSNRISVASSTSATDVVAFNNPNDCMSFGNLEAAPKRALNTSAATKVSIYDGVSKKVKKGTMADLKDYKNCGEASLIFVKFKDTVVQEIFVYQLDR